MHRGQGSGKKALMDTAVVLESFNTADFHLALYLNNTVSLSIGDSSTSRLVSTIFTLRPMEAALEATKSTATGGISSVSTHAAHNLGEDNATRLNRLETRETSTRNFQSAQEKWMIHSMTSSGRFSIPTDSLTS